MSFMSFDNYADHKKYRVLCKKCCVREAVKKCQTFFDGFPYHECVKGHHRGIDKYPQNLVLPNDLSVVLVHFLLVYIEHVNNTLLELWCIIFLLNMMLNVINEILIISCLCF